MDENKKDPMTMKMSVEIKNGKFIYHWEVGPIETQTGEMDLAADDIILFSKLLQTCSDHHRWQLKKETETIVGKLVLGSEREKQEGKL